MHHAISIYIYIHNPRSIENEVKSEDYRKIIITVFELPLLILISRSMKFFRNHSPVDGTKSSRVQSLLKRDAGNEI